MRLRTCLYTYFPPAAPSSARAKHDTISTIGNGFALFLALGFFIKSLAFLATWPNCIKFYRVVIALVIALIIFIKARYRPWALLILFSAL